MEADAGAEHPQQQAPEVKRADPGDVAFDRLLHAAGVSTDLVSAPEYLVSTKWINTTELANHELPITAHYHVQEPVVLILTYSKDLPGRIENAAEVAAFLRANLRERQVGR